MTTFAQLKQWKSPAVETVPLVMDGAWGMRVARVQDRLATVKAQLTMGGRSGPNAVELTEQEEELTTELAQLLEEGQEDGKVVEFKFRALGGDEYQAVINAHQPTKEQRAEATKVGMFVQWNEKTFKPALVAAALVEPQLSADEMAELWKDPSWTEADRQLLFEGAQTASLRRMTIDSRALSQDLGFELERDRARRAKAAGLKLDVEPGSEAEAILAELPDLRPVES